MYIYQKKIWHLNSAFKSTTVQQQSESLSSIKKVITLWNWRCSFNYDIANELREKTVWLTSISTFKSKQAPVNTGWLSQWIIVFSCFSSLSPFSLPLLPSFLSLIQMGVGGMSNITLALKSAVYFICILLLEQLSWVPAVFCFTKLCIQLLLTKRSIQLHILSKILSLLTYFYYIQPRHIFKITLEIKKENKYPLTFLKY